MDDPLRGPRRFLRWVVVGLVLLAIPALIYRTELTRLWHIASLFYSDADVVIDGGLRLVQRAVDTLCQASCECPGFVGH